MVFSISTHLDSLTLYDPLMDGHICIHCPLSHARKLEIGHQVANELISPLCLMQAYEHYWACV